MGTALETSLVGSYAVPRWLVDHEKLERQGYFDPRPWHTDAPQTPAVWDPDGLDGADRWGSTMPGSIMAPGGAPAPRARPGA